jgi:hypothetical protein
MRVRRWLHAALVRLLATDLTAATTELTIMPSSPSAAASRIGATDLDRLSVDLERAGLTLPPRILVMLIGCCGVRDASSYRDESDRLPVVRLTFAMSVGSIAC